MPSMNGSLRSSSERQDGIELTLTKRKIYIEEKLKAKIASETLQNQF